jgi:hypothetical protein
MKKFVIVILAGLLLAGCATIISGSRQTVVFAGPEGTRIFQEGIKVAEIPQGETEIATLLDRSVNGSYFVARKEGYHDTRFYVRMKVNGVVFVNLIIGGIVGGVIDVATGAAAKYPDYIEVEMEPLENTTRQELNRLEERPETIELEQI